jgi:small nuclear ribonucleoprotein (snRNP)-like protein
MTSIVEGTKEYSPKLENGDLIDKTLPEIKKETRCKIICPCMGREYKLTHGSIMVHLDSAMHKNWLLKLKNEHVKTYGHFNSTSDMINFVIKENRELKKQCSIQAAQLEYYETNFIKLSQNLGVSKPNFNFEQ